MIIIVTGTPGTGKSTLAKKLVRKGFRYVDVNSVIAANKEVVFGFDKRKDCKIIDTQKLGKILSDMIMNTNDNLVIDSHLSHMIDARDVDLCIVTKCSNLKKLEKRLKERGYPKEKIRENLDCEIFDICFNEAVEKGHNVKVIDTCKKYNLKSLLT